VRLAHHRFGVSWQIVPEVLPRLGKDPDTAAASRAEAAMMRVKKIDIAAPEATFHSA
jgi:predicted 3-demethylubiquinone-9 3-methyltransferase (glyoxalase superfamily)